MQSKRRGFLRQAFDVEDDQVFQDFSTDLGMMKALSLVLRLAPFGLFFAGLPCDSYNFMASATHGRHALAPWGNPFPFVHRGNVFVCRFAMLVLVSMIRGCVWAMEHPLRTTVQHMPPMEILLRDYFRPRMAKWF